MEAAAEAMPTAPAGRPDMAGDNTAVVPADEAGFAALVAARQTMVHAIAWHFLRDRAAAEDVAQEVFLSLYTHRRDITSPRHLNFWLRQVASRKCLDRKRRPAPEPLGADPPAPEPGGADPWQRERLARLVASLPGQPRMILLLRYQQEMPIAEIAQALHMPAATVRSHLRRGLAQLRRQWPPRPGAGKATGAPGTSELPRKEALR